MDDNTNLIPAVVSYQTLRKGLARPCHAAAPDVEAQLRGLLAGWWLSWEQTVRHFEGARCPTREQYDRITAELTAAEKANRKRNRM